MTEMRATEIPNSFQEVKSLIEAGRTPILPFEQNWLREELTRLGVEQGRLGKLLGEAMDQSSETWHDNAPADAVNHQSRVLSERAEKVISGLGLAAVLDYPHAKYEKVTLGSVIGVVYPGEVEAEYFLLTGLCRTLPDLRSGAIAPKELEVITVQSPLGGAILGQAAGDRVSYTAAKDRPMAVQIASVQQFDGRFLD